MQGARTIRSLAGSHGLKPKFLFVAPPSIDMLKERLVLRGAEVTHDTPFQSHSFNTPFQYNLSVHPIILTHPLNTDTPSHY